MVPGGDVERDTRVEQDTSNIAPDGQVFEETPNSPEGQAEEETPPKKRWSIKNIVIILLIAAFIIYLIVDSFTTKHITRLTTKFLDWVGMLGFWGVVIFGLVYIAATVLLIPGSILTIGAGFIFTRTNGGNQAIGTSIATAVVFAGASIGSTIAYLLGKYFMRDTISGWASKYRIFSAIDSAIENNGLKITFLLRLSPVLPYNVLNYLLGITSLSLTNYIIACIGFIPGTAAFAFIGSTVGSLTDVTNKQAQNGGSSKTVRLVILIIGIIASILVVVLVTFYARRELRKHLDEGDETAEGGDINAAENGDLSQIPPANYEATSN